MSPAFGRPGWRARPRLAAFGMLRRPRWRRLIGAKRTVWIDIRFNLRRARVDVPSTLKGTS